MAKFVAGCVVLFVLAAGFIVLSQAQDLAALLEAFRAEPLLQKLAWVVIALTVLALIPSALWLCDALLGQRRAVAALELRLGGVQQTTRDLVKSQVDVDAAVHHLARTDPEAAIGAIGERLVEAERNTQIQERRNAIGDLQSRVDELHAAQQGLTKRLGPVLETRRSIERLFADLDSREVDIDRLLTEIAGGDDATAIELHFKNLMDFVRRGHERCDEMEQAAKTIASLKEDYIELRARLVPHGRAKDGIRRQLKDLGEGRDRLAAEIDAVRQTPEGNLAARVQAFADDRKRLDDGVADIELQFSRLTALRRDVEGISANFDRALGLLAASADGGNGAGDAEARIAELSQFVKVTQARIDEIEDKMAAFGQFKVRFGDLQARLAPLEAEDGGVAGLIAQVGDIRDRLVARIKRIEADEHGDLAERVNTFIEAKQELEKRVSTVTEQFSKLATIRSDIAGLFDKLSSAAETSSN